MKFTILASGSTGNAMVVEGRGANILVDAGLSGKQLEKRMEERQIDPKDLTAVFVTHEHSDHVVGLRIIARKYNIPVYANQNTWLAMEKHCDGLAGEQRIVMETGSYIDIGKTRIQSYGLSHDAAEPVGYCFLDGDEKLALMTDLGYAGDSVIEEVSDSHVLILEANHDVNMLQIGNIPWNVKRRILGDLGHLSNEAAGVALARCANGNLHTVFLAHVSQDHNRLDIARMTVTQVAEDEGISLHRKGIILHDTYPDRATGWQEVSAKLLEV